MDHLADTLTGGLREESTPRLPVTKAQPTTKKVLISFKTGQGAGVGVKGREGVTHTQLG